MIERSFRIVVLFPLLALCCSPPKADPPAEKPAEEPPASMATAFEQPRGLVRNEAGASPGYVMFAPFNSDTLYLVDREGRVVHTWKNDKAGDSIYLQDDGSLFRLARIAEPPNFRAGGVAGYIQKLSWEGDVLWEWRMANERRILHHDIRPLPNGNILALAWEQKSAEDAKAAGRRPELVPEQGIWLDWIVEVEPRPPNDARVVWEWHLWDHLVQGPDPGRLDVNADREAPVVDAKELEELKALGYVPENATPEDVRSDFVHANSIDYHPRLDQIVVSARTLGEVWILDHSTTSAEARGSSGGRYGRGGDILYRWGNPKNYGRGTAADQQLFGQHNALWIPDGWPNAGHITIFNNGGGRANGDWSSVVEIEPPIDETGSYTLAERRAFRSGGPCLDATRRPTSTASSLPPYRGLIDWRAVTRSSAPAPRDASFEVTPAGDIVWEYRGPFHGELKIWQPQSAAQASLWILSEQSRSPPITRVSRDGNSFLSTRSRRATLLHHKRPEPGADRNAICERSLHPSSGRLQQRPER